MPCADPPEVVSRFESELDLAIVVVRRIRRQIPDVLQYDELLSFAREGLLEAARRYDPQRGVSFRRFASFRIRGAVLDGMRTHGGLSRRAYEKVRMLESALTVSEGLVEDTTAALAAGLSAGAAEERLADHLATLATAMAVGWGTPVARGEQGETVLADDRRGPEQLLQDAELVQLLRAELDRLPEAESALVRRHYLEGENIDEVARDLGLSKSWGSRLLSRGMVTLTKRLRGAT